MEERKTKGMEAWLKEYKEITQINGSTKRNKTRIKFRKEDKNKGRTRKGKLF